MSESSKRAADPTENAAKRPRLSTARAVHAVRVGDGATLYWFRLRETELGTLRADMEAARPDTYEDCKVWGKTMKRPRKMLAFLRDYAFSGSEHEAVSDERTPQSMRSAIALINDVCNTEQATRGVDFNSALVNWYKNGNEYIAKHSDDESGLRLPSTVATLSLGETRKLRVRRKSDNKIVKDVQLTHGTVYIMHGTRFQTNYTHEVPKVAGAKGAAMGERISVTLRQHMKK